MGSDNLLMITHLSKELNLIGYPKLPYSLEKVNEVKFKSKSSEEKLKIIFNSQLMIEALISTCFELVKHVKTAKDDDSALNKLNFECLKLQRKLKMNKSETEKIMTELTTTKTANQQLQIKIELLEKKMKDVEIKHKLHQKNQTNEQILKHRLKKKESELFELQKIVWKHFNMANQYHFPESFELQPLIQPNFSKLWSTVNYSHSRGKEEALKEAVRVFQKNNKVLMEESFLLKTSFLVFLQEMHEISELMVDKLHLPDFLLFNYKIKEVLDDVEKFNVQQYINILKEHFKVIRKICESFNEASFMVSDDLFVCWNKIIKSL